MIQIVRYQLMMNLHCIQLDLRIIWGGDNTVKKLKFWN